MADEYHMPRHCAGCDCSYQHQSANGEGVNAAGERVFLIACSWNCLGELIERAGLDLADPPNAQYLDYSLPHSATG